jgi:hypothetical protein
MTKPFVRKAGSLNHRSLSNRKSVISPTSARLPKGSSGLGCFDRYKIDYSEESTVWNLPGFLCGGGSRRTQDKHANRTLELLSIGDPLVQPLAQKPALCSEYMLISFPVR